MGLFGKKKSKSRAPETPYNPYVPPSSGFGGDPTAFSNALTPGAQPPSVASSQVYQPQATPVYQPAASAPSSYYDARVATSTAAEPPKKYVKVNGVMKLNPDYKRWKDAQSNTLPTSPPMAQALPIVSSMEDHAKLNEDLAEAIPLAESTNATIEILQEPEICVAAGMASDDMVDQLGRLLAKHECPVGLLNKLLLLSEFEVLDFIVDDSGSMQMVSDTVDPVTKRPQTRWREAQNRLKEMVEVLAYLPFQQIKIEFLNRPNTIVLIREGRDPQSFLADAYQQIDQVFASEPMGSTPALEKLQESLLMGQGKSIARYFFGDGIPNGGDFAQRQIVQILMHRENPAGNPITFMSCTNEDAQVEWMKDAEEVVPYCAESDDYDDEMREVLKDQGAALPYTRGFHLICQLVAAMCPDDLDAMDESVPFTKTTLDNLLGIQHNEASYRHYFDQFCLAQRQRPIEGPQDRIKKNMKWNYQDFLTAPVANNIPQVQAFKRQLKGH